MAGVESSNSSLTSTSHTLTGVPVMAAPAKPSGSVAAVASGVRTSTSYTAGSHPAPVATATDKSVPLLNALRPENRHVFLRPDAALPAASLQLAKDVLDRFAGRVADEQAEALRLWHEAKRRTGALKGKQGEKRKWGDEGAGLDREILARKPDEVLKIRRLTVEGFETEQVWQQARRIVGAALAQAEGVMEGLEAQEDTVKELGGESDNEDTPSGEPDASRTSEDDSEGDEDLEGAAADSEEEIAAGGVELGADSDVEGFEDEEEPGTEDDDASADEPAGEFVQDKHGLNDGFFSIDEFNKETQWFEEQDASGYPNTDQVSENEEIDWHTDPMAALQSKDAKGKKHSKGDRLGDVDFGLEDDYEDKDESEEEEDAGPTFGNMSLDAPEGASDDEDSKGVDAGLDDGIDLTADDIFYTDFFAPPLKKSKKGAGGGARAHGRDKPAPPEDRDIERAMEDVRHDLFEDLSEHSGSEDALSDVSAGDPKSRRSAHERRQAKLFEEIRKLEAESVAKRAWTLSGEATAADRPVNSLLEEDMDFEHTGKPVPVITEEVSESIEALIKRRILAQEFDEVIRRRPDATTFANGTTAAARRGLADLALDDNKSKKSLAELYEEQHVRDTEGSAYVSAADARLKREEQEVTALWDGVRASLDALASWHYRPRPVEPNIAIVADVPVVAMEDVQPTTAAGLAGAESRLAPQEVYKPGETREAVEKGEVVAPSGLPVAKGEMSREEKAARRRREKERARKRNDGAEGGAVGTGSAAAAGGKVVGKKGAQSKSAAALQRDTLAQLQKGGVRVINRKGEVVDLEGKKAKAAAAASGGSFKL